MKKIDRLTSFITAFVISMSSLLVLGMPRAFAATRTWDGGGSDNNMNTAANWSTDVAPIAGDDLVFPANQPRLTINNNFTNGTSFNSIVFSGAATQNSSYAITGNALTVVGGITNSMTGSQTGQSISANLTLGGTQTFTLGSSLGFGALNLSSYDLTISGSTNVEITSSLSGSGLITKQGTSTLILDGDNSGYSGAINILGGTLYALDPNSLANTGGTTIAAGAALSLSGCNTPTFNGNITLTGASIPPIADVITPKLSISNVSCSMGGGGAEEEVGTASNDKSVTFTGNITLGSDVTVGTYSKDLTLTGALSGAYSLNLIEGWSGKLIVSGSSNSTKTANGTYTAAPIVKTLSNSLPSKSLGVNYGIITLDGERGNTSVSGASILKGTGKVNSLSVYNGATVAPGRSPGSLTVVSILNLAAGSIFEVEIKDATDYDKIVVGDAASGTVTIDPAATIKGVLLTGFSIKAADTFTIIDNKRTGTAVTGTFKDLPEGATFKIGTGVFKITYKGGDGNDVVLSVVSVPTTPNTGFKLTMSNPYTVLITAFATTGAVYYLAHRRFTASKK